MCACERSDSMRVWLYARLSRDEDDELNSLTNQQNIIREYAEKNNYTVVGESFDDNIRLKQPCLLIILEKMMLRFFQ